MRVLLLSDIHANLVALQAVLANAGKVDQVWCLGDVVGYGPNPSECCAWVQEHAALTVAGNHDWAALGRIDLDDFNVYARAATIWTTQHLTPAAQAWLEDLPQRVVADTATLVHGSPRQPIWEYLLRASQAQRNFAYFVTPICFVGHTHVPIIFEEGALQRGESGISPTYNQPTPLTTGRYLVNPGSVGQPRDGDPRAAYALYDLDTQTVEFRRIAYDIAQTQQQMRAAGLPDPLVTRLARGS
jgi:predicted phosphodiesterase